MKFIFIDTNICLHFTDFTKYPWHKHFEEIDEITIVITHPLIEELDKKKYSGKNHLKSRATKALKNIESINDGQIFEGLSFQLFNEVISKSYVEGLGLDPNDGDDKMISAILMFKEHNHTIEEIVFISNDLGPRLKVSKYSIGSLKPFIDQQLISPESQLDKELKKLKIDNENLKNLFPKLSVSFAGNSKVNKFSVREKIEFHEELVQMKLNLVKNKFVKFDLLGDSEIDSHEKSNQIREKDFQIRALRKMMLNSPIHTFNTISEEEKKKYNKRLEKYYFEYEQYLRNEIEYNKTRTLTIDIQLFLNNLGTVPAEDIDLYLHFPDGFELFNDDSYPSEPLEPAEPTKPQSRFEISHFSPIDYADFGNINHNTEFVQSNMSNLSIKKTNSYDVNVNITKLKHNTQEALDKMYVVFKDYNDLINYKIDYEIRCSNIPQVVKGSVNVINSMADGI